MNKIGKFFSWEICSEDVAIKICDKTFFKGNISGIPTEIRWFFKVDHLKPGEKRKITLNYLGINYDAFIAMIATGRTRIFWKEALSKKFNSLYEKSPTFPAIRFKKITEQTYNIEFIDLNLIRKDENDNLESIIFEDEQRKQLIYSTKYERDPQIRQQVIKIHGKKCMACGFDFEKTYGALGKDFIEVHHINPLINSENKVEINPQTDFVCLCSNCHRMIHRNKERMLSLEDLKKKLRKRTI